MIKSVNHALAVSITQRATTGPGKETIGKRCVGAVRERQKRACNQKEKEEEEEGKDLSKTSSGPSKL